jgi:peroxiredoxin Q/BCP
MAKRRGLEVGDQAPRFTLKSSDGVDVDLSDHLGRSAIVLFFYPKADTPLCTAEACAFRDGGPQSLEDGVEVIGISSDPPDVLKRFGEKHRLPFILLSDPDGNVRRGYGVPRTFGVLPGRSTFLIDRSGIIRHIYNSQFKPARHVAEMLEALRSIREAT